jgi:anti-anti-sigma factor
MASSPAPAFDPCASDSDQLSITVAAEGHDVILRVTGEIDLATVGTLAMCLEHTAADSSGELIVDVGAVTFIDSTGISALMRTHEALQQAGRRLRVRNPGPVVHRVLLVAGIDQLLEGPSSGSPL